MGKEKTPGYGLRIKQYLRTKGDIGLPSHAYVLCIFICTQRNDFRNEKKPTLHIEKLGPNTPQQGSLQYLKQHPLNF